MKLLSIECNGQPDTEYIGKGYWKLKSPFHVKLYLTNSTILCTMDVGWITDFRSGSWIADICIPKKGNQTYNAIVLCHDMFYSGHLPRNVADELLKQGIILSSISDIRANIAYGFVHVFGGFSYCPFHKPLKSPYTHNRRYEHISFIKNGKLLSVYDMPCYP